MRFQRFALLTLLAASTASTASTASAIPVVKPGGKPGAAVSWKTSGNAVILKIAAGFDAPTVGKVIAQTVKGVSVGMAGPDLSITGMPEAKLLVALESVDVGEPAATGDGDDVDAMLSALRNPDGDEEQSGSSIRATQAADFSAVMGNKEELITAKVVEVKRQRFPLVLVTVKIQKMPKGVALAGVKSGSKITVLPRVKSKNGIVDPEDQPSQLNLGAWYVEAGDTVMLRLEPQPQDNVWVAAAFDRRVK